MTAGRLAELMRLSPPATTTVVDRLEKVGYARRVRDPDDRRRVMVESTPLAQRRAMAIYGVFQEISRDVFSRYTVAEGEVIRRFLADSLRITEEQLDALRAKPKRRR